MSLKHASDVSPSLLLPGTQIDGWTVLEHHSQASYGGVYRAVRTGQEHAGPVALKLSLYPWDPRFAREGEVLSRIHHPSVPRLLGRGVWRPAPGVEHPYLVMEWIEGTPLYAWARQHAPSTQQVLRLLLQLAQALAATHAIHDYQGASRLTWQSPPPGTPAYHSPEAGLFVLRSVRSPFAWFQATPADDLFALGVTAFCLVMGEYPPRPEPSQDMDGAWHLVRQNLRPLLERNSRVELQLRECILRLLSMEPAARGTVVPREDVSPRTPARTWGFWLALTAMGLAWFLEWSMRPEHSEPERVPASSHTPSAPEEPDADPAAVGDSSDKASRASTHVPTKQEAIAQDTLPKPQPSQTRPDAKGHCPGRKQVPLNGVCWLELPALDSDACRENGYAYIKGRCYAPVFTPHEKPQPTSAPSDSP